MRYFSIVSNLTPKKIWGLEQNKPSLIAKDFEDLGIPKEISYNILLARGVFKWFAVRRALIKLKELWKDEVIAPSLYALTHMKHGLSPRDREWLRGYLAAYEECRRDIRALCHSERWQVQDDDGEANRWLKGRENP